MLKKGDLIQASEKLYKAAEEAIKLLATEKNVSVLSKVKKEDRWKSEYLFDASLQLFVFYPEIKDIWKSAWILHVEGFHETRLDENKIKFYAENVKKLRKILEPFL
ncbi:PaREP1 family protein [Acidianus sp. HS-5]|uniref:PaREP1 family protein n=1 Tax=Acidianus sp. HS-5 TaxID=2886040 RepID=UPI001F388015|nr:PaREP1 family protein [Acidianus sp. HS-5]